MLLTPVCVSQEQLDKVLALNCLLPLFGVHTHRSSFNYQMQERAKAEDALKQYVSEC